MAYTMTATSKNLEIAEREHCKSNIIKFTSFDSCMGIIARKGQFLTAAHLVQVTGDGVHAKDHVTDVVSVFDEAPYDEIYLVGDIAGWTTTTFVKQFCEAKAEWFIDKDDDFSYGDKVKGIIGAHISNAPKIVLG